MSDSLMSLFGGMLWALGIFALVAIAVYVVGALGWMKLYQKAGSPYAWMAWIPYASNFAKGDFLQKANQDPVWMKWVMGLYPLLGFLPFATGFFRAAMIACGIFVLVNTFRWLSRIKANGVCYVLAILLPFLLPWVAVSAVEADCIASAE